MTRNLLAVAAAAALLGGGYGVPTTQASDDWDDETSRLKRKALEEVCIREREAMHNAAQKRVAERRRQIAEENARKTDDFNKLRAGIDPTNGNPLSRQQRRALQRRLLPKGGDAKQAPCASKGSAVGEAETPKGGSHA